MLMEATISMFVLMGLTWMGAIWASYQYPRKRDGGTGVRKFTERKAA